ncbi:MAG: hypothetical protein ABIU97_09790 [Dehalococcoidia bacterium]
MTVPEVALRVLAFVTGVSISFITIRSAIRTFILPRGARDAVVRLVFVAFRRFLRVVAPDTAPFARRDQVLAFYAPVGLVATAVFWLMSVWVGFGLLFWVTGADSIWAGLRESGSSLLTLGFVAPSSGFQALLVFTEATIGLGLVALLVGYLPTLYSAFSRRELAVNLLEVRADSPPSAVAMLSRFHRIGVWHELNSEWRSWERWFADLEETHTSIAALAFYRSPQSDHSWIVAAGTVLDAASLQRSLIDVPRDPQADLAIRAGYVALRRIADYFQIPYDADPKPTDPTAISRVMFEQAADELATAGLELREDRDAAFRDFNGWRVNYDLPLLALSRMVDAPLARWNGEAERGTPSRRPGHVGEPAA